MDQFPENIQFKYPWRTYQDRVLKELGDHLEDNKLHIVAPPGSGKTVLGIEVALRLNKPTLILCPTIALRTQWIHRFCHLFMDSAIIPEWITTDINEPKFLTVSTYQSLHSAGFDVFEKLKKTNINTILADEAHHLKNAWWNTLDQLSEYLKPTIVGLTATPPYDVSYSEWQRYLEFNGPIDLEIAVPELIKNGELCPHQDLIRLSLPIPKDMKALKSFRKKSESIFNEIKNDPQLPEILQSHPFIKYPLENLADIYENISFYSSVLIYLNHCDYKIENHHFKITGNDPHYLPDLNLFWTEQLLNYYLFSDHPHFDQYFLHRDGLEVKLKENGLVERSKVKLESLDSLNTRLIRNISKLNSILEIANLEFEYLENNLKMLILSDYIRKEYFLKSDKNLITLKKMGVLPIFEILRRSKPDFNIAVLTGSLVIIPRTATHHFNDIGFSTLPYDSQFVYSEIGNAEKDNIVINMTSAFRNGAFEILIGTKALLGEGWDAPFLNSLILASTIGSFVSSNQMRGRVIRTSPSNPEKTSNIWHLACIDPTSLNGGFDLETLERRFNAFLGTTLGNEIKIENGLSRLRLPSNFLSLESLYKFNDINNIRASKRGNLKEVWEKGISNGVSLTEEIKVPTPPKYVITKFRKLHFRRTIAYSLASLGSAFISFLWNAFENLFYSLRQFRNVDDFHTWILSISIIGTLSFTIPALNHLRTYLKYRDITKDFHKIAKALLKTMIHFEFVGTPEDEINIITSISKDGTVSCLLDGCTSHEKSIFMAWLKEILMPIDNPRYLIIRKHFFNKIHTQKDYHSVPSILAKNKETAQYFAETWQKIVGNCDLIFTRNINGRNTLLKARFNSLSSEFDEQPIQIRKWT